MAVLYSGFVRFFRILFCALTLCCAVTPQNGAARPQQEQPAPKDEMFAGTVTAVADSSLTATRTGSTESQTFVITPETRFEGPKPQPNLRVTIRFVKTDRGSTAVRVIVRTPAKK